MNPSKNPSALRSKSEITEALLQLMKQHVYAEITVKQILLEAGVARKTFYRNFTSKDDVLNSYIDGIMLQYVQALQQIEDCRLAHILDIIFEFCIKNKELLFLLHDNSLLHLLLNKWNTFIPMAHYQITGADCVLFQTYSKLQTEYIIAFNIGSVWNIIAKWVENDMVDSPKEIKATILDYLSKIAAFV